MASVSFGFIGVGIMGEGMVKNLLKVCFKKLAYISSYCK
jgi:3-hydroxyisobutyrate dehydrogenase-like beta-hydroxyacid dehydrogenase